MLNILNRVGLIFSIPLLYTIFLSIAIYKGNFKEELEHLNGFVVYDWNRFSLTVMCAPRQKRQK